MRIKYLIPLLALMAIVLTGCGNLSVNNSKQPIINGLKKTLQVKNDVALSMVPNGDQTMVIDGKNVTIPGGTFTAVKTLINSNTAINNTVVDIVGNQVTDENIAIIIYYAQKIHIDPEKMLKLISKE